MVARGGQFRIPKHIVATMSRGDLDTAFGAGKVSHEDYRARLEELTAGQPASTASVPTPVEGKPYTTISEDIRTQAGGSTEGELEAVSAYGERLKDVQEAKSSGHIDPLEGEELSSEAYEDYAKSASKAKSEYSEKKLTQTQKAREATKSTGAAIQPGLFGVSEGFATKPQDITPRMSEDVPTEEVVKSYRKRGKTSVQSSGVSLPQPETGPKGRAVQLNMPGMPTPAGATESAPYDIATGIIRNKPEGGKGSDEAPSTDTVIVPNVGTGGGVETPESYAPHAERSEDYAGGAVSEEERSRIPRSLLPRGLGTGIFTPGMRQKDIIGERQESGVRAFSQKTRKADLVSQALEAGAIDEEEAEALGGTQAQLPARIGIQGRIDARRGVIEAQKEETKAKKQEEYGASKEAYESQATEMGLHVHRMPTGRAIYDPEVDELVQWLPDRKTPDAPAPTKSQMYEGVPVEYHPRGPESSSDLWARAFRPRTGPMTESESKLHEETGGGYRPQDLDVESGTAKAATELESLEASMQRSESTGVLPTRQQPIKSPSSGIQRSGNRLTRELSAEATDLTKDVEFIHHPTLGTIAFRNEGGENKILHHVPKSGSEPMDESGLRSVVDMATTGDEDAQKVRDSIGNYRNSIGQIQAVARTFFNRKGELKPSPSPHDEDSFALPRSHIVGFLKSVKGYTPSSNPMSRAWSNRPAGGIPNTLSNAVEGLRGLGEDVMRRGIESFKPAEAQRNVIRAAEFERRPVKDESGNPLYKPCNNRGRGNCSVANARIKKKLDNDAICPECKTPKEAVTYATDKLIRSGKKTTLSKATAGNMIDTSLEGFKKLISHSADKKSAAVASARKTREGRSSGTASATGAIVTALTESPDNTHREEGIRVLRGLGHTVSDEGVHDLTSCEHVGCKREAAAAAKRPAAPTVQIPESAGDVAAAAGTKPITPAQGAAPEPAAPGAFAGPVKTVRKGLREQVTARREAKKFVETDEEPKA